MRGGSSVGVCTDMMGGFSKSIGAPSSLVSVPCEQLKINTFSTDEVVNMFHFCQPIGYGAIGLNFLEMGMESKFINAMAGLDFRKMAIGARKDAVFCLNLYSEIPEGIGILSEL